MWFPLKESCLGKEQVGANTKKYKKNKFIKVKGFQ
jgi:hypothetical protein